jgi:hypothetical protein
MLQKRTGLQRCLLKVGFSKIIHLPKPDLIFVASEEKQ